MRKLVSICALLACMLFAGCSDNDSPQAPEFKVLSTTAKFDASGGEGVITVQSPVPFTAVSEEEWCTVSVSGMTKVNVVVPVNETIMGRTAMVAITAGGETLRVPVYQAGDIFICDLEDYSFPYEGGSRAFSLKTAREVIVSEVPDWLSYEVKAEEIVFTAKPAESDRFARISVSCGGNSTTAMFRQWSVEGAYSLSFEDNDGVPDTGTAVVSRNQSGTYNVKTTGMVINATLKASYNEETGQMVFSCGQKLGSASGYIVVVCGLASDGYVTWDSKVQYAASVGFSKENDKVRFEFHDNGTWAEKTLVGLHYGGFQNDEYKGGFGSAYNLVMTKQ